MKLIVAIAHECDKHKLGDALLQNGLTFTKLGSTGGFLRYGNVTVLIGVEDVRYGAGDRRDHKRLPVVGAERQPARTQTLPVFQRSARLPRIPFASKPAAQLPSCFN